MSTNLNLQSLLLILLFVVHITQRNSANVIKDVFDYLDKVC